MGRKKLKQAPLREAMFEIYWQSLRDATGFPVDKNFELGIGKFHRVIADAFPVKKQLFPIPPMDVYARPAYQFWAGNAVWPVIQFGPGFLSVNETEKNYEWEKTYRPNVEKALNALVKSYEQEPNFNKVALKYIDSVDISSETDVHKFISENLQTDLINRFEIPGKPIGLNINQAFEVGGSTVVLRIQTAVNNSNNSKALVWITSVEKTGTFKSEDVLSWLDGAHKLTSDLFVQMLNPAFYASFDR